MNDVIAKAELEALILRHCTPAIVRSLDYSGWSVKRCTRKGFYKVVNPLYVFKQVHYQNGRGVTRLAIANLIIPVGAMIYVGRNAFDYDTTYVRKMRASEAYVHSIASLRDGQQLKSAFSWYSREFLYTPGSIVKPKFKFSKQEDLCGSGIHFFVNLKDAKNW